jgi:lysozyme family protein
MQHPFDVLRAEYENDIRQARILPRFQRQCDEATDKIIRQLPIYQPVFEQTGVPAIVQGVLSYREMDCDPTRGIAQGWRWDQRSRDIPYIGPFKSKVEADVAGLRLDHLDQVARASTGWTAAHALYEEELWNGFGPRNHGRRSGYVVGGTQLYTGGMYVADGKWSESTSDERPGTLALMMTVARRRPDLALPGLILDAQGTVPSPVPAPLPVPLGHGDGDTTTWIQESLKKLGFSLDVDGNYGRQTKRAVMAFQTLHHLHVDGICGPQTTAAIKGLA